MATNRHQPQTPTTPDPTRSKTTTTSPSPNPKTLEKPESSSKFKSKPPTRRTTRSNTTTTTASPKPQTLEKPESSSKSKPKSLIFADTAEAPPASLLASLPGRKLQLLDLLRFLRPTPTLPVLLHGAAATGKTRTLLKAFAHLRLPFAYVGFRSCHSPRSLFDSVLTQLLHSSPPPRRCDKASDFIVSLREAVNKVIGESKSTKVVYLVFDNLELVRSWEKGAAITSLLLRLRDLVWMPQLGLIYVSNATPDAYYSMTGSIEPVYVYFPDYSVDELRDILIMNQANPKLYLSFLSVVLKPFYRVTRRVDELATAFELLFEKYCEPLADPNVVPDKDMKRKLFNYIQPHLAASLNETFSVPEMVSSDGHMNGVGAKKGNVRREGGGRRDGCLNELDFHMSVSAKYLLLSAFLASRNPATLDAALFDPTGGSDNHKRKRKNSRTSMDQRESAAEEMLVKGPGTFPLERLLAIFKCITSVSKDAFEDEATNDDNLSEIRRIDLMSDVLLQLSTLCNSNFLCKSGSCPLEGSVRYRSTIDEDLALKVARSIDFPLSKYLYRR